MSAATYGISEHVVRIFVEGEDAVENRAKGYVPSWTGLLRRLQDWLDAEKILPVFMSSSGGGMHCGYYSVGDAARIEAWLKDNGGVRDRKRDVW